MMSLTGLVAVLLLMLFDYGGLADNWLAGATLVMVSVISLLSPAARAVMTRQSWWCTFFLYMTLTLAWSTASRYSALAIGAMLIEIGIAIYIGAVLERTLSQRTLGTGLKLLLIASLYAGLALPVSTVGSEGEWVGIFDSKNSLGMFSAFSFIVFLSYLSGWRRVVWTAVSVTLVALSGSAGGLIVLLIGLVVHLLSRRLYFMVGGGLRSRALFLAAIAITVFVIWQCTDQLLALLGKDSTLSRRTDIWAVLLDYASGSWIFGSGIGGQIYADSYLLGRIQATAGPTVHSTHNGYLTVLLGGGLIGLSLLGLALFSSVRFVDRLRHSPGVARDAVFLLSALGGYVAAAMVEDVTLKRGSLFFLFYGISRLTMGELRSGLGSGGDEGLGRNGVHEYRAMPRARRNQAAPQRVGPQDGRSVKPGGGGPGGGSPWSGGGSRPRTTMQVGVGR